MAEILRFATADDEQRLLSGAKRMEYKAGATILAEGERRCALFVLRRGRAAVERSHASYKVEVSELFPGELFGEMGFIEAHPASASVVARDPCSVDVIDQEQVNELIAQDPLFSGRFYQSIAHILSRRLRATTVDALSEFSWGTGHFAGDDASQETTPPTWGGGSPLRGDKR